MSTIRLKTDQHRLIANLRYAFSPRSMLGELLQNARRAQARHIHITVGGDTLTVSDDGIGIADLQSLIFIAESGWDPALQARENAFGLGVLSCLYFAELLSVHSGHQAFSAPTATIIRGDAIAVQAATPRTGTEVRLDGVQCSPASPNLAEWVERQLKWLCEAFPVPVSLNGVELARPLAYSALPWRDTAVGRVLIDLATSPREWRCFLQGLPIGHAPFWTSTPQVVLLNDDMLARLPDRQYLLNEEEDNRRIQAAVEEAYRQALIEAKAHLTDSGFVGRYANTCLSSSNADLLNDVPFAPAIWFRDWEHHPPGYRQCRAYDPRCDLSAQEVLQREDLQAGGVWRIDGDDWDESAAQVYLQTRKAFLLEERRLDAGHWLMEWIQPIASHQVGIQYGAIRHRDADLPLANAIELVLVDTLSVGLAGIDWVPPWYPVDAVRQGGTLYLTPEAGRVTPLVSDYFVNDRYCEDRANDDAQTLRTFIALGCSHDTAQVVKALLPDSLRYTPQPKLTGASVHLEFDSDGKLEAVTA